MQNKLIIAIDGYSSTGKSTLAKKLANKLEYSHIDSGAMYRAVTLYALANGMINDKGQVNKQDLLAALPHIFILFIWNPEIEVNEVFLNGANVENLIREMNVSENVSEVAKIAEVRFAMVGQQRRMAQSGGVVMDGRDIGTTVFPDADVKLFITASAEERAKRRYKELIEKGTIVSFEEVLANINERDYLDSHREVSPLRKAEDAIEIDNGNISIQETFDIALQIVRNKMVMA